MLKNASCEEGCGMCQKEEEIRDLNGRRRRDLSLQSIYRKDYHSKMEHLPAQIDLPKLTKNESGNIQGKPKDYFNINSTYLSNYQNNNPEKMERVFSKQLTANAVQSLKNYKSTYQVNYQELPLLGQEPYKIANHEFYNMNSRFKNETEYKQNYKILGSVEATERRREGRKHSVRQPIKLFETTQRSAYKGAHRIDNSAPVIPVNNVTTLPTQSFLFNTTYKNEFSARQHRAEPANQKQKKHLVNFYNF